MADPDDIAALGEVGGFGHLLGALQLDIGLAVRLDLLDQHDRLAVALLLGRALVLAGQHEIPGYECGQHQQAGEHDLQHRAQRCRVDPAARLLQVDERKDYADRSPDRGIERSEEYTSELQSLMRISYAV